jgi:hypothetical protein
MIPLETGEIYSMTNIITCLKIIQVDLQDKFGPDAKIRHPRGDLEKNLE